LKVCCAPIVTEFAKITRHLSFMYIYPLLEKNERIHLSQFAGSHASGRIRDAGVAGRNENWHQLDAQFPFDPYQLPISKHWVEPDYVQWKGLPGLEEEYDESDDEIVDDCEDDEAEENTGTDDDFEE
jgi:RNA polymerase I-specific transcription initiation factor RRN3